MADWNLPLLSSLYVDFLALLKGRDEDSITLGKNIITNPIVGTIRYDRPGNKFQEWNGSAWIDLVISLASGGVGGSTPAAARTTLGIGTIGTQDANNVAITGGTISNLGSLGVNGNADIGGVLELGSANNVVSDPTGLILANKLSGIVPVANLGNGTPTTLTFLRGDGTWANAAMYRNSQSLNTSVSVTGLSNYDTVLTGFTNPSKMFWVGASLLNKGNFLDTENYNGHYWFPNATTLRFQIDNFNGSPKNHTIAGMVLEIF